jgi:hypothetical protein
VLAGLAWLTATLLIAEIVFSIAGIGESEYLRPDPVCGVAPMPNKHVTWRKEGFARLQFNSMGMQDGERQLAKPPGVRRIAVVGDSYVEAVQVDRSQNFCTLLEKSLNKRLPMRKWEVLNFGVAASNLGQIYLRMRERAFMFHPDIVVVPIRVDATFELIPKPKADFLTARPTFYIDDNGNLAEDRRIMQAWQHSAEGKRMRATGWLREHSHVWGVISSMAESVAEWLAGMRQGTGWTAEVTNKQTAFDSGTERDTRTPPAATTAASNITPAQKEANDRRATQYYWPIVDALLHKMSDECRLHHCRLVIVRLPVWQNCWRNDTETALLAKTAQKYGCDYLDTSPRFAVESQTGEPIWYNIHFTPRGHSLFADEVLKYLMSAKVAL